MKIENVTKMKFDLQRFAGGNVKRFEVGKKYYMRAICDDDIVSHFEVVKRTEKTITIKDIDNQKESRRKIYIDESVETVCPYGNYSMASVLSADREFEHYYYITFITNEGKKMQWRYYNLEEAEKIIDLNLTKNLNYKRAIIEDENHKKINEYDKYCARGLIKPSNVQAVEVVASDNNVISEYQPIGALVEKFDPSTVAVSEIKTVDNSESETKEIAKVKELYYIQKVVNDSGKTNYYIVAKDDERTESKILNYCPVTSGYYKNQLISKKKAEKMVANGLAVILDYSIVNVKYKSTFDGYKYFVLVEFPTKTKAIQIEDIETYDLTNIIEGLDPSGYYQFLITYHNFSLKKINALGGRVIDAKGEIVATFDAKGELNIIKPIDDYKEYSPFWSWKVGLSPVVSPYPEIDPDDDDPKSEKNEVAEVIENNSTPEVINNADDMAIVEVVDESTKVEFDSDIYMLDAFGFCVKKADYELDQFGFYEEKNAKEERFYNEIYDECVMTEEAFDAAVNMEYEAKFEAEWQAEEEFVEKKNRMSKVAKAIMNAPIGTKIITDNHYSNDSDPHIWTITGWSNTKYLTPEKRTFEIRYALNRENIYKFLMDGVYYNITLEYPNENILHFESDNQSAEVEKSDSVNDSSAVVVAVADESNKEDDEISKVIELIKQDTYYQRALMMKNRVKQYAELKMLAYCTVKTYAPALYEKCSRVSMSDFATWLYDHIADQLMPPVENVDNFQLEPSAKVKIKTLPRRRKVTKQKLDEVCDNLFSMEEMARIEQSTVLKSVVKRRKRSKNTLNAERNYDLFEIDNIAA